MFPYFLDVYEHYSQNESQNNPLIITRKRFGIPKRSPNASMAPGRFRIDLRSHFDILLGPFGVVFGTRFVELEPGPPSNHKSWFAGFSRVRRLRSASTIRWPFRSICSECYWKGVLPPTPHPYPPCHGPCVTAAPTDLFSFLDRLD